MGLQVTFDRGAVCRTEGGNSDLSGPGGRLARGSPKESLLLSNNTEVLGREECKDAAGGADLAQRPILTA